MGLSVDEVRAGSRTALAEVDEPGPEGELAATDDSPPPPEAGPPPPDACARRRAAAAASPRSPPPPPAPEPPRPTPAPRSPRPRQAAPAEAGAADPPKLEAARGPRRPSRARRRRRRRPRPRRRAARRRRRRRRRRLRPTDRGRDSADEGDRADGRRQDPTQAVLAPLDGSDATGAALFGRSTNSVVLQVRPKASSPPPRASPTPSGSTARRQNGCRWPRPRSTERASIAGSFQVPPRCSAYSPADLRPDRHLAHRRRRLRGRRWPGARKPAARPYSGETRAARPDHRPDRSSADAEG